MPIDERAALKLRAEDESDLAVISACLQDALVLVADLAFVPEEQSFVLVANRFRWEEAAPGADAHERTMCGVAFRDVSRVSYRGFRRRDSRTILSLLAIRSEAGDTGSVIYLDFAGGASIRLEAGRILCHVRDLGEPWPTPWRPGHDLDVPA
jgi:hypothetical protein